MAVKTCQVEVWVVVASTGDYEVGRDADAAEERYADDIGGNECRRMVKVTLTVPLPVAVELTGVVPEESSEGAELTVI